ncbi:uncharacterized protein BXZ73DRAFT_47929 [Epithele typhae]|uniref:uncharacterized protein n=1 Tax=Epithele typhae TaxID=378194 RepID=UPI0020085485|nr:uncharacterized protein BXZ73DRAFT_47929 [Epithele typhae]KAH9929510.1 hypothetical protein BXZ73DRAFT_47929 [Epithele typhae]
MHEPHTSSIRAFARTFCATSPFSAGGGSGLVRPAPPPLPREAQREFEELVRAAQAPLSASSSVREEEAQMAMHPDARAPLKAEFEGDVNPMTGEQGGPRREPVGKWGEDEGDWSFKGRVSDF